MTKAATKRVALYVRVSTADQTTKNQRRELEAVAKRHGSNVVQVFADSRISGAKDRKDRPGLDSLLKAVARREIDMVAASSVDRLGRSLKNLVEVLSDLHAKGGDLYLHPGPRHVDTKRPDNVSNDGGVRRIRARHQRQACPVRHRSGKSRGRGTRPPVPQRQQC